MGHKEKFGSIHKKLSAGHREFDVQIQGRREWYDLAVSDLALFMGDDEEIQFADARFTDPESGAFAPVLFIFTENFVIEITGDQDGRERSTSVRTRQSLVGMEVRSGVAHNSQREWPGRFSVELDYGFGLVVQLPGEKGNSDDTHFVELRELLPSLRADLLK